MQSPLWHDFPVPGPALISVGYEGRTVDDLVQDLRRESVKVLVDVRLTPLSRKPGLSKRRLAAALDQVGIAYVHLPALGNPKDNREPFRAGDPASHDRFRTLLTSDGAGQALERIAALLDDGPVAVLCFERSQEHCHRRLVVDAVLEIKPAAQLIEI